MSDKEDSSPGGSLFFFVCLFVCFLRECNVVGKEINKGRKGININQLVR